MADEQVDKTSEESIAAENLAASSVAPNGEQMTGSVDEAMAAMAAALAEEAANNPQADEDDEPQVQAASTTQTHQPEEEFPAEDAEPAEDAPLPAYDGGENGLPLKVSDEEIKRILKIKVPIIVRLAEKTMAMHDVLAFCPGTIIEFSKSVEEELDLMINNKCIGGGVAVKVGENFGLKVIRIGSLQQTIKALGGESAPEAGASAPTGEKNSIESQESIDALFNSVT